MTYQPKNQVLDLRSCIDQIFTYIQNAQVDAGAWTEYPAFKPIKKFFISAAGRVNTILPALTLLEKETALDVTGDQLVSGAAFTFEFVSDGSDADQLVREADNYAFMLESLLSNLPHGLFDKDVATGHIQFTLMSLETYYGVFRGAVQNASAFYNVIQIRAAYTFRQTAFLNQ
jgi:hypothetical protein